MKSFLLTDEDVVMGIYILVSFSVLACVDILRLENGPEKLTVPVA
jgi:hypothetical protein